MRTMVKGKQRLNVLFAVVLENGWEIFATELDKESGIGFGLVCGFADEIGSFSAKEIEPHIVSAASGHQLHECLPAPGWEWE